MENGLDVSLVFFNLRKAFDSRVPHLPLLQKHGLKQQWIALYMYLSNTAICCGGWSFIWYHFCGVWHFTEFSSEAFIVYVNHVSSLTLTDGSKLTKHADDIILYKPISCPEDYSGLQTEIDAIQGCTSSSCWTLNPYKCKYLICSRERHPHLPPTGLLLAAITGWKLLLSRGLGDFKVNLVWSHWVNMH